jgi:branched-subunit amino acid aminotransferase/4-amino-4-deoxychorismate lyase
MPDELGKADQVFLTGSAAEASPVGEIIGSAGRYAPPRARSAA